MVASPGSATVCCCAERTAVAAMAPMPLAHVVLAQVGGHSLGLAGGSRGVQ